MIAKPMIAAVLVAGLLAYGAVGNAPAFGGRGPTPRAQQRITITGLGKALIPPSDKPDPALANATVTLDDGTVYYVYGWGGIIVAKKGDGKKVEVTGFPGEKNGQKTITAASVHVKIIVVE